MKVWVVYSDGLGDATTFGAGDASVEVGWVDDRPMRHVEVHDNKMATLKNCLPLPEYTNQGGESTSNMP